MSNLSKVFIIILSFFTAVSSYANNPIKSSKNPSKPMSSLKLNKVAKSSLISKRVNLNQANAAQISRAFKGIGPKRSQAIVAYREAHGVFNDINNLSLVKGISKHFVEKNKERLSQTFVL